MSDEFDADDAPPPPPPPAPPPPPPPPPAPEPAPPPAAPTGIADLSTAAPIAGVDPNPPPPPSAGVDLATTPPSPPPPPPPVVAADPVPAPPPAPESTPVPPPPPPVEAAAPPIVAADVPAEMPAAATPPPEPEPEREMPTADSGPGVTDPHGLGAAVSRLSGSSRKHGHAAFMVLAHVLDEGEQVVVVTSCRFRGAPAALALSDRRLLVVNAREWEPDVLPVGLEPGLTVQGWQDERHAALVFTRDGHELVVDQIGDRAMAQEIAAGVRSKVGG